MQSNLLKLKDKTFIITGGTSEVGRALSIMLAGLGADIVIIDKNPEKARRIIEQIHEAHETNESHGKATYVEADLTSNESATEAISRAVEAFGGMDVLVSALMTSKLGEISSTNYLSDFERLIDVNLRSAVYATHAVVPFMKGRKRGKIIYLVPDLVRFGSDRESLTSATCGGLIYYAKSLARELAPNNIAVNCITMGPTEDYLLARDPEAVSIKQAEEKLFQNMPMGRALQADEIAQVVTLIASSWADAVTGQTWAVNGGLTMF